MIIFKTNFQKNMLNETNGQTISNFGAFLERSKGICPYFNGTSYMSYYNNNLNTNEISAFIGTNTKPADDDVLMGRYELTVNKRSWRISTGQLSIGIPTDRLMIVVVSDGGVTNRKIYYSNVSVFDGTWKYVGFTFKNGVLKLYVNGEEVTTSSWVDVGITTLYQGDMPLGLGAQNITGTPSAYMIGHLQAPIVDNKELSKGEIRKLYKDFLEIQSQTSFDVSYPNFRLNTVDPIISVGGDGICQITGKVGTNTRALTSYEGIEYNGTNAFTNLNPLVPYIQNLTKFTILLDVIPRDRTPLDNVIRCASFAGVTQNYQFQIAQLPTGEIRFFVLNDTNNVINIKTTLARAEARQRMTIAVVQDGVQAKIYINGNAVQMTNDGTDLGFSFADLALNSMRLGCILRVNTPEAFFRPGKVLNLSIYDRVLTLAECKKYHLRDKAFYNYDFQNDTIEFQDSVTRNAPLGRDVKSGVREIRSQGNERRLENISLGLINNSAFSTGGAYGQRDFTLMKTDLTSRIEIQLMSSAPVNAPGLSNQNAYYVARPVNTGFLSLAKITNGVVNAVSGDPAVPFLTSNTRYDFRIIRTRQNRTMYWKLSTSADYQLILSSINPFVEQSFDVQIAINLALYFGPGARIKKISFNPFY